LIVGDYFVPAPFDNPKIPKATYKDAALRAASLHAGDTDIGLAEGRDTGQSL
jgi:hypothetical protein